MQTTHPDLERLRAEYAARRPNGQAYSLFNPGHLFMVQQRQRAVVRALREEGFSPLAGRRILEVGCGNGNVLRDLLACGADPRNLHGIDLLDWRLAEAASLSPHLSFSKADARRLPYPAACFDLVLQFTALSSILDPAVRQAVAAEMRRVLRPGGLVLWYDFWLNPTNPQTRGIPPAEVRSLFPGCRHRFRRVTLAPPVTRLVAPYSWLACYLLERIPLLCSHYLAVIRKG